MEHFTLNDFVLPLWWYDKKYCITDWVNILSCEEEGEEGWYVLPNSESPVDIWELYALDMNRGRFLEIKGGKFAKLKLSNHKPCKDVSEFKVDDYSLLSVNIKRLNTIEDYYYLDLVTYAEQTRTLLTENNVTSSTRIALSLTGKTGSLFW